MYSSQIVIFGEELSILANYLISCSVRTTPDYHHLHSLFQACSATWIWVLILEEGPKQLDLAFLESKEEERRLLIEEKKTGEDEKKGERSGASCSSSDLPCMDKLRDQLT